MRELRFTRMVSSDHFGLDRDGLAVRTRVFIHHDKIVVRNSSYIHPAFLPPSHPPRLLIPILAGADPLMVINLPKLPGRSLPPFTFRETDCRNCRRPIRELALLARGNLPGKGHDDLRRA